MQGTRQSRCLSHAAPAANPLTACSVHPGPSGHQVLAELLAGLMAQAAGEVAGGREPAARADPRLQGLPPPMIPHFEEQRSSLCLQLVRRGEWRGWQGQMAAAEL